MFNKRLCVFFLLVIAHYVHSSGRGEKDDPVSLRNSPLLHVPYYVQSLHSSDDLQPSDAPGRIASPVVFHTTPPDVNASSSLSPFDTTLPRINASVPLSLADLAQLHMAPLHMTPSKVNESGILESREANSIPLLDLRSDEDGNDLQEPGISRSKSRVSSGNLDEPPKEVAAVDTILVSGIAVDVVEVTSQELVANKNSVLPAPAEKTYCDCCW